MARRVARPADLCHSSDMSLELFRRMPLPVCVALAAAGLLQASCSPQITVSPCLTNNGGCDVHATCTTNASNAPTCACNGGYVGSGKFCSPEMGGNPDGGPGFDGGVGTDGGQDAGNGPDGGTGQCVTSADCPSSETCFEGQCISGADAGRCSSATSCSGNSNGTVCLPSGNCGCTTASDCPNSSASCTGGVCTSSGGTPDGGACAYCRCLDGTCAITASGTCDDGSSCCLSDVSCEGNPNGFSCITTSSGANLCGCTSASECTTSVAGPACAYYQPWGGNFCGCNTSSDCANAASGHYCNTTQEFCGCQSDTDCPSGTTCNLAQEQCS